MSEELEDLSQDWCDFMSDSSYFMVGVAGFVRGLANSHRNWPHEDQIFVMIQLH